MNFFDQFKHKRLIAAHRGFRAKYPENTLLSFEKSIGKCDFLEFDVQLSKDKIPVVFHDDKLFRTSNIHHYKEHIKNDRLKISDFSYEELKKFDLSTWFYKSNPFQEELEKPSKIEHILSLKEVISFAKNKALPLNVEIKHNHFKALKKEDILTILEVIEEQDYIKGVLISSFHHKYLKWVKKLDKRFATAALAHEKYPKNNVKYLKKLNVEAYHINEKLLHSNQIKKIIKAGFIVNVYTVNDHSKFEEYYKMGITAIFTDILR